MTSESAAIALVQKDVKHIRESVDEFKKEVRQGFVTTHKKQDDTNGRVKNLERWQSFTIGFCTCISILVIPVLIYVIQSQL